MRLAQAPPRAAGRGSGSGSGRGRGSGRCRRRSCPNAGGRAAAAALALAAAAAAALALAAAAAPPPGPAHATPPCTAFDAEKVWRAYDDIYTGTVVSAEPLPRSGRAGDPPAVRSDAERAGLGGMLPRSGPAAGAGSAAGAGAAPDAVRITFEVARTLKGDPQPARWHADVPSRTTCPGDHCVDGADLYLPGTEAFYLDGYNGHYAPVSGACGIGTAGIGPGVSGTVFSYYERLYGFAPPPDNPCHNAAHVLAVRDGGAGGDVACVRPSTAERLGWEPFDRARWAGSHEPAMPEYDLPVERAAALYAGEPGQAFALSLSRLPAVNETAVLTASYSGGGAGGPLRGIPYNATVRLSPGLEFVGLDGAKAVRSYYPDGSAHAHAFGIPPGSEGETHVFAATVRAVSEGYADASYWGDYHSASIDMYVGAKAGLLVDDYHRMASPVPDMSGFRHYGGGWHAAAARMAGDAAGAMPLQIAK